MPSYEELKAELANIAKLVDTFPDQVKPVAFQVLVDHFLSTAPAVDGTPPAAQRHRVTRKKATPAAGEAAKPAAKKPKGASGESYSIDRQLDLRGNKSIPSFKVFVDEKKPGSAAEFNAVAVYYLRKLLGLENVTLSQAYTCYREVTRRPPEAFRQSFTDTKNKQGWIEFNPAGNLEIPHRGTVFVENDLPAPTKQNKK